MLFPYSYVLYFERPFLVLIIKTAMAVFINVTENIAEFLTQLQFCYIDNT